MTQLKFFEDQTYKKVRSESYNYDFNKVTGSFIRWGKTFEDDPVMAPYPEILDIEVEERCNGVPGLNGVESPCHFCSPDGTMVNTPSGEQNISTIKVGDVVLSWNGVSVVENEVVETYKHSEAKELIIIELVNGYSIKLTPDHLVSLENGEWKKAGDLTLDDDIKIIQI